MSKFLHEDNNDYDDNNDTRTIAILWIFTRNSGAKMGVSQNVIYIPQQFLFNPFPNDRF